MWALVLSLGMSLDRALNDVISGHCTFSLVSRHPNFFNSFFPATSRSSINLTLHIIFLLKLFLLVMINTLNCYKEVENNIVMSF